MTNLVQNIQKNLKTGTCPHGLSPGACPVCSMGGGSVRKADRNYTKPGEMSYHECAMIGAMMRARALANKHHAKQLQAWAENSRSFENRIEKVFVLISQFANKISGHILLKPISVLINVTVLPSINFIKNTLAVISDIMQQLTNIKQSILDIAAKLTAVFGEIKNFINKKVSELVSNVKTKFKNIFKIFKKHDSDNEDNKIDEDKKIFNFKSILTKIKTFMRKENDKRTED